MANPNLAKISHFIRPQVRLHDDHLSGAVLLFAIIYIACKHYISSVNYVLKNLAVQFI